MNIKQLNEVLTTFIDNRPYADFDVAGLYETIIPEDFGSISFDEIDKVKDYLKLDEVETEDALRGIRNTIVKYCYEHTNKVDREKEIAEYQAKNPNGSFKDFRKQSKYERMWDQMSAFTHVIDMELHKRFGHA